MKKYGPWTFDDDNLTLTHSNGYEIDVEEWKTSAEVLDWIFQIHAKPWGKKADTMAGLLEAIEDIINPQASLCSFGHDHGPIDVRETFEKENEKV